MTTGVQLMYENGRDVGRRTRYIQEENTSSPIISYPFKPVARPRTCVINKSAQTLFIQLIELSLRSRDNNKHATRQSYKVSSKYLEPQRVYSRHLIEG